MKRYLSLCLLLVCTATLWAQTDSGYGGDYDPTNPAHPSGKPAYKLSVKVEGSGSAGIVINESTMIAGDAVTARHKFEVGADVILVAYAAEGYRFTGWQQNEAVISAATPYTYVMPAEDTELTAVFVYDPAAPDNPYVIPTSYYVTAEAYPSHAGAVSHSQMRVPMGTATEIWAYNREHYRFKSWICGDSIVSTDACYKFDMPSENIHLTALFEYDPDAPEHPNFHPVFLLTYVVDGVVYRTDSVRMGTQLIPLEEPVKDGYIFSGWVGLPDTMPAYDVTVTGTFGRNEYTVTYMVDGQVHHTDSVAYGTVLVPIAEPEKEGYTFSGWSEIPETMPAEDVMVTGEFVLNSTQTDEQGLVYELNATGHAFTVAGYTETLNDEVVIPTALYELPVEAIKDNALMGVEQIKSIVIPESVGAVGDKAFYGCSSLLVVEWNATAPVRAECFDKVDNHGNMLVFVSNAATEVTYKGNVVIDDEADNIVLTQNMPFRNPHEFTARSISYSHDFAKKTKIGEAGGWEALVLPFDVQTIASEKKGTLLPFGQADFSTSLPYWAAEMQADGTFATVDDIKANTPFIMEVPNSDEYEDIYNVEGTVTFSATDVTVHTTTDGQQPTANGYALLATYEGVTSSDGVYALNDEEYVTDDNTFLPGGVFVADSRDIRPFEAYVYSDDASRAPYLRIGGKEVTGIEQLRIQDSEFINVYDLMGRKISIGSWNELPKGIYIINGKKRLIK